MEQLTRILGIALFVSIVVLFGCLWLLHTAIIDGNAWKGVVAVAGVLGGGFVVAVIGGGLAGR